MIQRTRFGVPTRGARKRKQNSLVVSPTGGIHAGVAPTNLPPGYSEVAQNFVPADDGIRPRYGLAQSDPATLDTPIIGAVNLWDIDGNEAAFAASDTSVYMYHQDIQTWRELSHVTFTADAYSAETSSVPSADSNYYWSTQPIYEVNSNLIWAIASNNSQYIKEFSVVSSTTTYSDFTWCWTMGNTHYAKNVGAINDRLVFFNSSSSTGVRYPTRVVWSARGNAKDFLVASGAGFEDLMQMRGEGTAMVRYSNMLILFTENEVWRANPTLDDYAFRFDRISDSIGCPVGRTAVATPLGVMFLGADYEVYTTDGSQIVPVGVIGGEGPSRIQSIIKAQASALDRAFGMYNAQERRYELYFPTTGSSSGFANRALFYNVDERSWWPQTYTHELSAGLYASDQEIVTWASIASTWAGMPGNWNDYIAQTDQRWSTLFDGSNGTVYQVRSTQTTDEGTAIDARWRSHGLAQRDRTRQTHLTEVWVDYQATSSSSASIYVGNSRQTDAFDSGTAFSITSSNGPAFVPVWKTSSQPNFEIRLNDGGTPTITMFSATIQDASKF